MRHRANKLRNYQITELQNSSRGYVLITLMLFVTLLAIAAIAVLPEIAFQIKRDREEEMIHRATGYRRAVQKYYRKFGRYPARIEELENTNNLRFLRKRYKDPITGQDFKILRLGDPKLMGMGQMGLVGAPGGAIKPGLVNPNMPQVTGLPQSLNTVTLNAGSSNPSDAAANPNSSVSSSSSSSSDTSSSTQQVFGGGLILGVACNSEAKTIREFYNKNHYNDWLFIYDPTGDRGGLLNGPAQMGFGNGVGGLLPPSAGQLQRPPNSGPSAPGQPPGPNPNPEPMPPDQ